MTTCDHCWHWNHMSKMSLKAMVVDTDEPSINGYTCCRCGEEKWVTTVLSEHGPHHPDRPIERRTVTHEPG